MLTKAEYLEKHKARFDKAGLSKADRGARYRQYTQSKAMKVGGVVGRSKQAGEAFRENRVLNTSYSTFSQCTKDYATALIDPWTVKMPPCVPDNVTLPSFKFGGRARGTFILGTKGVGWVLVNPYMCYNNVDYYGFVTDATYTGATVVGGGIPGVNPFASDSPFERGDFGDDLNQSRLVGAGVRVRYTGTEITRSGQCISFRSPTNSDFVGTGKTASQLLTYKESSSNPVDRDWHYAVYRPATPADITYHNPITLGGNFALLVAVFGGQPGQSFEFDAVSWFEVVGNNLPNLTKSHSDPIGMAAVSMAMPIIQPTRNPTSSLRDFFHEMSAGVATAMSFMPRLPGQAGVIQSAVANTAALGSYLL